MDSFSEPYTRLGDDVSIDEVRTRVRLLEDQHRANGIPLSGRVLHVCHYLPVNATLNTRAGVLSPPPTPPAKTSEVPPSPTSDVPQLANGVPATTATSAWTLSPRYGHAAMISGIRSLSSTHEQLIIGWTGDIASPTPGEKIASDTVSPADKESLDRALAVYQPKESDPDDDKKTSYVPVWLDDKVAHGHYDGYCKQSVCLFSWPSS